MEPRRRFRFLKELAAGGFGKVYLAEMITGDNFSSVVAIKLLHGQWLDNDEIVMRSRDEARLLGRLRHRNIVRVEDLTSINGQCAIVMEYLAGADVKNAITWLKDNGRTFPRQASFEIVGAVAAALDAAFNHRPLQGGEPLQVIHRDIKPSNAMITREGEVKVLDFGTARASFEDREAKTQALAFGSQAYMAPERMLAEPDTPAADIFSLGVTLYELLTLESFGKIFLRPDRFESTLNERVNNVDFSPLPPEVASEARETLRLMLAYEPTGRPSATQVVELMEVFAEQARDIGLKRFARDFVKEIIEATMPETDPSDPLPGQTIVEDTSSFIANPLASIPQAPPPSGVSGPRPSVSGPRPSVSGPRPSGLTSPRPAAPPPPPEEENPFQVPPELMEQPVELASGRPSASVEPSASRPPPPPIGPTVIPRTPPELWGEGADGGVAEAPKNGVKAPEVGRSDRGSISPRVSGPRDIPGGAVKVEGRPGKVEGPVVDRKRPADNETVADPLPPPPQKGGFGKILAALAVMGFLGLVALTAVYFMFLRQPEPTVVTAGTPGTATVVATDNVPSGTDTQDFSPNAPGKGGAILVAPGTSRVVFTSLKTEWNGSRNYRLKDLDPGVLRTKVTLASGGTPVWTDLKVEADKTCVFTFKGSAWEKSECR